MSKSGKFYIKAAEEKDIPLALNLRKKLFRDTGVPEQAFQENLDSLLLQEYTNAYKKNDMLHFFAYDREFDEQPAAVAGLLLKRDFPYYLFKPGFYGWVIDVYTEHEYRGRGLATMLLEKVSLWGQAKGVEELKLISASENARRIYENFGFRPTWEMSMNVGGHRTYNDYIDLGKGI
ncbi:MAG: GCN5-related N-acetyltransferase [Eubacterium sp.]|jgi:GNAT superfamily N-acetyltransferase|nr:GCN5-related N-acetyltransferase [Eubacterium sp.]